VARCLPPAPPSAARAAFAEFSTGRGLSAPATARSAAVRLLVFVLSSEGGAFTACGLSFRGCGLLVLVAAAGVLLLGLHLPDFL
jgi:hypothetical protein